MSKLPTGAVVFWLLCLPGTAFAQQWTTTTPLPNGGYAGPAVAYWNGFLYEAGGLGTNGIMHSLGSEADADATNVYYAQTFGDGTIGPWQAGTPLPVPLFYATGLAVNGYFYVLGG